tara:strand:+ start:306 stop:947 length:642 start_codon:yes stop_codon:yes gene_type:complete
MSNKKIFNDGEADAFFDRYKKGQDLKPLKFLRDWLVPFKKNINKMLEIGCGNGFSLDYLSNEIKAKAFGIEPSKNAVNFVKKKFPSIKINNGFSDKLKLDDSYFDYVHLGFFLYLVDRKYYFRSISEADRTLKFGGFLSIIDFDTPLQYSQRYSHKDGVFSHKMDNSRIFISSGFYTLVNKQSISLSSLNFNTNIDERVSIQLLYKEPKIFKV